MIELRNIAGVVQTVDHWVETYFYVLSSVLNDGLLEHPSAFALLEENMSKFIESQVDHSGSQQFFDEKRKSGVKNALEFSDDVLDKGVLLSKIAESVGFGNDQIKFFQVG